MSLTGCFDKLGDAVNPIVVKELRQAVQSRFVIAVLLLFLLVQLVFMGSYLVVQSFNGQLHAVDFQAGSRVFAVLQGILLGTCMVCIPAYSGFRFAAERSDVHVDLFYISALRPRSIVAGKLVAALVLTLLIFSACAPFMAFTYFLRGIDLTTIFFVLGLDFLVVALTILLALFVAVVPAGRVLKMLLGVGALLLAGFAFGYALFSTTLVLQGGLPALIDDADFGAVCLVVVLETFGAMLLLFTAAVGLLSPPSTNRTLPLRLALTLFCLLGGALLAGSAALLEATWPISVWIDSVDVLLSIGVLVAISEREAWGPRLARTIPRRWWRRPLAWLFYSGAAGGLTWVCLLYGTCLLAEALATLALVPIVAGGGEALWNELADSAVFFSYLFCYALTALFLRRTLLRLPPVYTWGLALGLLVLGMGLPYLLTFLVYYRDWEFATVYPWLLTDPIAATQLVTGTVRADPYLVPGFLGAWAAIVTLLNVPWYVRQLRRFRPPAGRATAAGELVRPILSNTPLDATRTAP